MHSGVPSSPSSTAAFASPSVFAEKRRRLKERLRSLTVLEQEGDNDLQLPPRPPSTPTSSLGSASPGAQFVASSLSQQPQSLPPSAEAAWDQCRNAVKVLRDSGRRLQLGGRYWTTTSAAMHAPLEEVHVDAMARHYCTAVEVSSANRMVCEMQGACRSCCLKTRRLRLQVLLERKQKEVVELESLCALWENGRSGTASDYPPSATTEP